MNQGTLIHFEKKLYNIILILLSVIILAFVIFIQNASVISVSELLGVKISSRENIAMLISEKTENKEVFHFPLLFNGHEIPYDWQSNTLYIPQNMNTKTFSGTIDSEYGNLFFSDKVTVTDYPEMYTDQGEEYYLGIASEDSNLVEEYKNSLVIKEKDISELDKSTSISDNAVYEIYLVWDNNYARYNVIFTGMPVISLTYDSYDESSMSWTGGYKIIDPYHNGKEYLEDSLQFHLRGDSTSHSDKKSYTLKLNDKKSLLGLRKDEDFALVAELGDNGYVHNKLAYDLWNRISATNNTYGDDTVDSDFIEVFYDYTYSGVYNLCERIDRKQCGLKEGDYLYRLDEMYSEEETDPSKLKQYYYQIKWPKVSEESDFEIINRFENTFFSKEKINYEYAKTLLNMDNIIDMNLYSMLICGVDNWDANCLYIARKRDNYRISEVMWDMNESFGDNEWFEFTEEYLNSDQMMIPYVKRLYDENPKEMSELLFNRWKKLRENVITKEDLNLRVDNMSEYLFKSGAMTREANSWAKYLKPEWRYEYIHRFIDERIDYLDKYIEEEYKINQDIP